MIDIKTQSIKDRPYVRLFTPKNIEKFNENLASESPLINQCELLDANSAYDSFSRKYLELFDKYFPYVKMPRKAFENKPHIAKGIQVSIRNRNKLYKKYVNNPTGVNKEIWKK